MFIVVVLENEIKKHERFIDSQLYLVLSLSETAVSIIKTHYTYYRTLLLKIYYTCCYAVSYT